MTSYVLLIADLSTVYTCDRFPIHKLQCSCIALLPPRQQQSANVRHLTNRAPPAYSLVASTDLSETEEETSMSEPEPEPDAAEPDTPPPPYTP